MAWQGSPTAVTRVPGAAAEEAGQQQALGDGGVLVLVEQDDPELVAQDRGRPRAGCWRASRGEGDLVAEVEQVAARAWRRGSAATRSSSSRRARGRLGDLAQVGVGELGAVQGVAAARCRTRAASAGVTRCSASSASSARRSLTRSGKERGQRRVGAGGLAQHAGGELVAGGVGEQPGGGLQADAQAVVGEQAARRRRGRWRSRGSPGGLLGRARSMTVGVGDAGLDQGLADALGEFAGGLVGEGEAEDLLGGDLAGADQPHHARGHHRGLARTGSGHDDLRGGRRGDAGRLLRGERDAEQLLELLGIGDAGWHVERLAGATDNRRAASSISADLKAPGTPARAGARSVQPTDSCCHARSLDDLPPLRPRAARGPEGAVGAVLAGGRGEPLVQDAPGRGGEQVADPLRRSSGSCACTLGSASPPSFWAAPWRSWTSSAPPGSGRAPSKSVVDGALAHRELVDGELGVAGDLGRRSASACRS